jgi:FkbM family methyltransferase
MALVGLRRLVRLARRARRMTAVITQRDGWWWPATDTDAHHIIMRDCEPDVRALLPHIRGREVIVQAGANVGVYACALADHFQHVFTAEPDPTNYECLKANLKARDSLERITALHAAFGEALGGCAPVEVTAGNCGAHRVDFNRGQIPVWTIDGLELEACNAIWLDVEGSELLALKGAADTIERYSPTISVEDKGLHRAFGIEDGALQAWLAERGYELVARQGRDKIFNRRA